MRHDLLHMHKESSKTVRIKMVQEAAAKRCRRSTEGKSRVESMLVTSSDVVLLENELLNIISIVQTNIFTHKRINRSLSGCRLA